MTGRLIGIATVCLGVILIATAGGYLLGTSDTPDTEQAQAVREAAERAALATALDDARAEARRRGRSEGASWAYAKARPPEPTMGSKPA